MNLLGTEEPQGLEREGSPIRTVSVAEAMAPHLNPEAQRLLASGIRNVVLELDRGADGKAYSAKRGSLLFKESPDSERPDQEYVREHRLFISLTKMFHSASDPLKGPWPKRFAFLINKLVDAGKLDYGVLATPIVLPLAPISGVPQRWLICLYVFSDYSREELNEAGGAERMAGE